MKRACKDAANEKAAYGTPEWPWFAFGYYERGNSYVTSGVATAVEYDAKFSNKCGAMERVTVLCKYDLRAQKVTEVILSAGERR